MRCLVLTLVVLAAVAPTWAQDAETDPVRNAAFVDLRPEAIQLLEAARRSSNGSAPPAVAETYAAVARRLQHAEPGWVVPDPAAPDRRCLGVLEALRRQLRAEAPEVIAAWRHYADPRARPLVAAAGADTEALARVAEQYPMTESAVSALARAGDHHLETGAVERAYGCYRAAAGHLRRGEAVPPPLERRLEVVRRARGGDPVAAMPSKPPVLRGPDTAWLHLSGAAAVRRRPALAPATVAVAGPTWIGTLRRGDGGALVPAWRYEDLGATQQADAAVRLDEQCRRWATRILWRRSRWGSASLPRHGPATDAPAPVVTGDLIVGLLGRPAATPRALEAVRDHMAARFRAGRGRWRSHMDRLDDIWDGELPPARSLVALPRAADGDRPPQPRWRLGGPNGVPGCGANSDFVSEPVSSGPDLLIGAFSTAREIAAHVVRLDARTGRVRSAVYVGGGQREAVRGAMGGMLRIPPGMAIGLVDGQIIAVSNVGIVAACNAETGSVRWLHRYSQRDRPSEVSAPDRGLAPPTALGDGVVVAPWDADHVLWLDSATGAERMRWPMDDRHLYRFVGPLPDGGVLALQGTEPGAEARLVALLPSSPAPAVLASGGVDGGWRAAVVQRGYAWLAGSHGIDRVNLATSEVVRAHWFGRDRPEQVDCALAGHRLVVATDRHVHWFRLSGE